MILIMIACCLYVGVIFAISVLISTIASGSSTSIIMLLAVWVCCIVVIPSSATPIAYLIMGHQSCNQADSDCKLTGILNDNNENKLFDAYLKERFHVDSSMGTEYLRLRYQETPNFQKRRMHQAGDLAALFAEQNIAADSRIENAVRWICRLSPYGLLQSICTSLANTGYDQDRGLRMSLITYEKKVAAYIDQPQFWFDKPFDAQGAPYYSFRQDTPLESIGNSLIDIFLLCAFGACIFMIAYLKFIKMEII
jgi:hypothetical protein